MQRPIFILGAHKSGTSLLRALFDNHPDVFTVPVEAHFFENMAWWVDYAYRRTLPARITRNGFIERAMAWMRAYNTSADPEADSIAKDIFDETEFRTALGRLLPAAPPDQEPVAYFEAFTGAIYRAIWREPLDPARRIVEKSVENAEYAHDLYTLFPEARFIHIIRNPYANLVSIRKYKGGKRYPWIGPAIRSLYNANYFLYRNRRLLPHYYQIKYEDLVRAPEPLIRTLCSAVELDFRGSMLRPTFLGKPWGGNSTDGQPFEGISSERLHAWLQEIIPLEVGLVNKFLPHVLVDFEYERLEPSGSVYRRARDEPLKHFIANRLVYRATQY
jgi:hypothetical protein